MIGNGLKGYSKNTLVDGLLKTNVIMYYRGNLKGFLFLLFFRAAHFTTCHWSLRIVLFPVWMFYRLIFNWVLGIDISEYTLVGKNFQVWHGVGCIVHPDTVIGDHVILRHNTTVGEARSGGGVPVIGSWVDVGANSVVIGEISVGDHVVIGAGSVVTKSVPARAVVVGNPARIIRYNE